MTKKKSTNKGMLEIVPIKQIEPVEIINGQEIREPSLKFKRWVELFTDKSNSKFYGNKTQCALAAYDTNNYDSASSIGYQNFRKLQFLASEILEKEGFGFAEMMKIGMAKVMHGTFADWDKMMERCGYFQPKDKVGIEIGNTYNIANLHDDIMKARRERGLPIE
jgi:hypothetical protein